MGKLATSGVRHQHTTLMQRQPQVRTCSEKCNKHQDIGCLSQEGFREGRAILSQNLFPLFNFSLATGIAKHALGLAS